MAKFSVEAPVLVRLSVIVEAASEEEAIEKLYDGEWELELTPENDAIEDVYYEWDIYEKIVQGNVFYGNINNINVEQVKD